MPESQPLSNEAQQSIIAALIIVSVTPFLALAVKEYCYCHLDY